MLHIIMTQYALKIVLIKFKVQGEAAVTKELTQLHVIEIFAPVNATKISNKHSGGVEITNVPKIKSQWRHRGMFICRWNKTAGDNKQLGRGFSYSCHRVSVCNRGSGCI